MVKRFDSVALPSVWSAGVFAVGAVLTALICGSRLAQAWTLAPDLGHGWALPWLMGWLVWERVSTAQGSMRSSSPGLGLWIALGFGCVAFFGLRLFLEPFPLWPGLLWILAGLLYAYLLTVAWLAGKMSWVKLLVGPLALLFTAIPWPSTVENLFLHPLRQALAMGVAEMLNLMSVPAFSEGATIRISGGVVGVDEACGGMRSLQTALMIGWFVGELGRMPLTRRLGLLMSAALAAIGGNFLRALVLTWLMDVGGVDLLNKWHDPAGYLALGSTLIVVVLLGWLWRSKAPAVIGAAVMAVRFPRSAIVWVLCSLAACVVTEFGVRAWYGSREQTNGQALAWTVRWPDKAKNFRKFPLADSAREMLRPDDFSSAAWRTPEDRERSGYYIVWESGQLARNAPFVHTPEICLPLTGIELIGRDNPEIANVGGVSIPFEVYRFQQHGQPMYVFRVVWNPDELRAASAPRKTDNRGKWFGERWADVRARRVAVRAQVLTLALSGEKSREDALRAFHEELALIVRTDAREK